MTKWDPESTYKINKNSWVCQGPEFNHGVKKINIDKGHRLISHQSKAKILSSTDTK